MLVLCYFCARFFFSRAVFCAYFVLVLCLLGTRFVLKTGTEFAENFIKIFFSVLTLCLLCAYFVRILCFQDSVPVLCFPIEENYEFHISFLCHFCASFCANVVPSLCCFCASSVPILSRKY